MNKEVIAGCVVQYCDPKDIEIEYRDIPGYSKYQASNIGTVRYIGPRSKSGPRPCSLYMVPTSVGSYLRSTAMSDKFGRSREVHYLVLLAFKGPPPNDGMVYEVNHIDGNKHNNLPSNLEWMTRSDNVKHAYRSGLRSDCVPVVLTDTVTGTVHEYRTMAELGEYFGKSKDWAAELVTKTKDKLYLDRYRIEPDWDSYQASNDSRRSDIAAKNYVDGKIIITKSAQHAAWLTGVKRATVGWNLDTGYMCSGWVFFRYVDGIQWPDYTKEEAIESHIAYANLKPAREKRYGVLVKDYYNDTVVTYTTNESAAEALGVSKGAVALYLQENKQYLIKGCVLKYPDDETPWPEFSEDYLSVARDIVKPEHPALRVTDTESDTTEMFPGVGSFAERLGIKIASVSSYLRKVAPKGNRLYRKRYKLERVYS